MSLRSITARPFDFPFDGMLDPARVAVIAIDLQVDFLSPNGYLAQKGYDPAPLRKILPNVASVINAARAAGCLIVHTRQGYRADLADMSVYERWRRRRARLEGTDALVRGSAGFEIAPEVPVAEGDVIIDKTANGAFTYTDLDHVLRWRGITHLILMGCTTDVCVHCTLREANDRNYQCLVVEDACASGDPYAHDAAIYMVTVEDGVFGVVAKTLDVVVALS
jgi:nicotinamidase-related amidase